MIAGGRSRRFGSDKALALLHGRPLIDHAIGILEPRVDAVVVCGREWGGLLSLADLPAPGLGPLGGIAAALAHAEENGFDSVLTIACDMPHVPAEVLDGLLRAAPSYCADAPILGHWPAELALALQSHLGAHKAQRSLLSIRRWAEAAGAVPIAAPGLRNVNTPADLA